MQNGKRTNEFISLQNNEPADTSKADTVAISPKQRKSFLNRVLAGCLGQSRMVRGNEKGVYKIFAGFLVAFLSIGMVGAQTLGGLNDLTSGSEYFNEIITSGARGGAIGNMSQSYYNYIRNWSNYTNVTTNAIEPKSAAGSLTSPYVFADEFNTLVGAIRGIWNLTNDNGTPGNLTDDSHFWGINGEPTDGVRLTVHGEVQLGNLAGFPATPVAGMIFFNTNDSHFYYHNGMEWRPLDTLDCDTCNDATAYEYTCTDDGDGDNVGVWTTDNVECTPVDYDETGATAYDWDLATITRQTVICADVVPEDNLCKRPTHDDTCEPIDLAYETRCVEVDGDWGVWQFDDCGNRIGVGALGLDPVTPCTSGCTNVIPRNRLEGTTYYHLPDGSNPDVHPMHPEYTSGEPCLNSEGVACFGGYILGHLDDDDYTCLDDSTEVGCGGGFEGTNWGDPYPLDDYEIYRNVGEDRAIGNYKIWGICNEDDSLACGNADSVRTSSEPTTDLCIGGTASDVTDGWLEEVGAAGRSLGAIDNFKKTIASLLPPASSLMAAATEEDEDVVMDDSTCMTVITQCIDGSNLSVWCPGGTNECPAVGNSWTWECVDEEADLTVKCAAPHLDWIIGDWDGVCSGGKEHRQVLCTDTPGEMSCGLDGHGACYSLEDCLEAGADATDYAETRRGDVTGVGYLQPMHMGSGNTYQDIRYLDVDDDGIPDTEKKCNLNAYQCQETTGVCCDEVSGTCEGPARYCFSDIDCTNNSFPNCRESGATGVADWQEIRCDCGVEECATDLYNSATTYNPEDKVCNATKPSGDNCEVVNYSCLSIPANSTRCDSEILTEDTSATLSAVCTEGIACLYGCDSGYHYDDSSGTPECVVNTCTGSTPANSSLCSGDDAGLTADTTRTLVSSCGAPKCEYTCESGYHLDGGNCVEDVTYSCLNIPDNSTVCSGDDTGLAADTDSTLYSTSSSCGAPKCEYYCSTGYHYDGGECVVTYNCTGTTPTNAQMCTNDNIGLTSDTERSVGPNCTTAEKCEYICSNGYEYDPIREECTSVVDHLKSRTCGADGLWHSDIAHSDNPCGTGYLHCSDTTTYPVYLYNVAYIYTEGDQVAPPSYDIDGGDPDNNCVVSREISLDSVFSGVYGSIYSFLITDPAVSYLNLQLFRDGVMEMNSTTGGSSPLNTTFGIHNYDDCSADFKMKAHYSDGTDIFSNIVSISTSNCHSIVGNYHNMPDPYGDSDNMCITGSTLTTNFFLANGVNPESPIGGKIFIDEDRTTYLSDGFVRFYTGSPSSSKIYSVSGGLIDSLAAECH